LKWSILCGNKTNGRFAVDPFAVAIAVAVVVVVAVAVFAVVIDDDDVTAAVGMVVAVVVVASAAVADGAGLNKSATKVGRVTARMVGPPLQLLPTMAPSLFRVGVLTLTLMVGV
jgi:hypothetical protein